MKHLYRIWCTILSCCMLSVYSMTQESPPMIMPSWFDTHSDDYEQQLNALLTDNTYSPKSLEFQAALQYMLQRALQAIDHIAVADILQRCANANIQIVKERKYALRIFTETKILPMNHNIHNHDNHGYIEKITALLTKIEHYCYVL